MQDAAQSYTKSDGEVVRLMLQRPALLAPKKCYMLSALIKVSQLTSTTAMSLMCWMCCEASVCTVQHL